MIIIILRWFLLSCIQIHVGKRYSQHMKLTHSSVTANKIQDVDSFVRTYESRIPTISNAEAPSEEEQNSINAFFDALSPSDIKIIEALKPSQLDSLLPGATSHYDADALCFMPSLSLQDIADPTSLSKAVISLAEKTYNDAITLGVSGEVPLGGYTMTPQNRSMTCAVLSSLLNAGVAYVATKETARLMGHLPMLRSTLSLQPKRKKCQ